MKGTMKKVLATALVMALSGGVYAQGAGGAGGGGAGAGAGGNGSAGA
ncbi:hypothetical protein H3V53_39595, partial [Paraburkholderia bengalensis]